MHFVFNLTFAGQEAFQTAEMRHLEANL